MAQRRSTASARSPADIQRKQGRCSISGEYSDDPSAPEKDDCLDESSTGKLHCHKYGRCNVKENSPRNLSPANVSSQAVDVSPASPPSLKRRHKPNTLYANDFVFSSTEKVKIQRCKPKSGSEQLLLLTCDSSEALLENKSTDVNSENDRKVPSASDPTLSERRSRAAKKRVNCKNLSSSRNCSRRSVDSHLGQNASTTRSKRSNVANSSLSDEQLQTDSDVSVTKRRHKPNTLYANDFVLSSTEKVTNTVPLTVSRKKRQPQKKLTAGNITETCEDDADAERPVYSNHLTSLLFFKSVLL